VSIKKVSAIFQNRLSTIDWKLLVFLLLFLNVKLAIKVLAVILIYVLRWDFKFNFSLKNSRLPFFYLIVIAITLFNWLISGLLTNSNYSFAIGAGILFWLLCILAVHQIKLSVEKNDPVVIHQTILIFFIINAVVSLAVYSSIIWETGTINPYRYQGNFQKYFIGTGDYIKGITLDTSTTNAVINAFGVIYFLIRNKYSWSILCMTILLLTGSNITNLLLCSTLLYILFFQSNKNQKSIIVIYFLLLVVFWVKVSPQNNSYITTAYENIFYNRTPQNKPLLKDIPITEKPDSILTGDERKQKIAQRFLDSMYVIRLTKKNTNNTAIKAKEAALFNPGEKPIIPRPSIHSASFQHRNDTTPFQLSLLRFIKTDSLEQSVAAISQYKMPGKIIGLIQTFNYFRLYPAKIITGTGTGMFSSKLAFKISALKITGGYPQKYAFVNNAFKNNNLSVYLNFFIKPAGLHSLINTPNSAFTQLLSEYGVAGICSFLFFYLRFFLKRIKNLTYGFPLLLLMTALFFMEYWFEQLSVVVLFELLIFVDIKDVRLEEQLV